LSDEDLRSPGVHKLLLDHLEKAEEENSALKSFRAQFHDADKRNGILEEKLRISKANEAISMGSLAAGSASVGYAKYLWASQPSGWVALGMGILLIGVGIIAKVIRR
jgi:hypothetical protein